MSGASPAGSGPYGPATPLVRRFLVELAQLGSDARSRVVQRFDEQSRTAAFHDADATVGELIERSGRMEARDALGGPLLQLVRAPVNRTPVAKAEPADTEDALRDLDPIAEPALAALLALLVRDLLPDAQFRLLYAPFTGVLDVDR